MMLKLISDPTVYPIRECALTDVAERLALVPELQPLDKNDAYDRPDGGLNVAFGQRRMQWDLQLVALDEAKFKDLLELAGSSAYSRTRGPAWAFPNFDRDTVLSAPLTNSTACWQADGPTQTLQKGSPLLQSRAVVAYYEDEMGNLQQAASGAARFAPCVLGKGFLSGDGAPNLFTLAHPTSGDTGWSAVLGSPSISWDSSFPSNVLGKPGCTLIRSTTTGYMNFSAGGSCPATAGERFYARVWLRGNGRVGLQVTIGAQTSSTSLVQLRSDRWTPVEHQFVRTNATTSFTVTVVCADDGDDRAIWAAARHAYETADGGSPEPWQPWTDQTSDAGDALIYDASGMPTGDYTLALAGLMPPQGCDAVIVGVQGTEGLAMQWDGAVGPVFDYGDGTLTIASGSWWQRGRPYTLILRHEPGLGASMRLAYLEDGARLPSVQTAGPGTAGAAQLGGGPYVTVGAGPTAAAHPEEATIQMLRVDRGAWSDAEAQLWERCLLAPGFRDLIRATAGRYYAMGEPSGGPIKGVPTHYALHVPLTEMDVDSDFAVVL